ncbi:MAG: 1-acyl-sn-glycerol-3-phosphate acyltransferase [Clostridia bacterium]|nr:1-acyl-sn-glycerol-3-phosphate acyltransferase [Clostridia bacterium]
MELNKIKYKSHVKPLDTSQKPPKVWHFMTWFVKVMSKYLMRGKIRKLEKINMKELKPPYLLLSNHQTFCDMEVNAILTYPYDFHSITSFEGYYGFWGIRGLLMKWVGCIPKRRFTTDPHLVPSCETVLNEYGDILNIYPEAAYTNIGTISPFPDSYGALVKKLGKPLVIVVHRGNYLRAPFWDWQRKRKVKTYSTMKKVLDVEDIERMTPTEINEVIRREMDHDEYRYQKENSIVIDEPWRAEGLHKALYQCPHCKKEHQMLSKGITLWCMNCGKKWDMTELGEMRAQNGETEFSHIPDWYNWQRENVKKEVEAGRYNFEDDVDVFAMPNYKKIIPLGKAVIKQSIENGLTIEGHYNGEDYKISRPSRGLYNIHMEYNNCFKRKDPCLQISVADNTFLCYTTKKDVVTKVYFATLAIHEKLMRERAEKRQKKAEAEKLNN